MKDVVTIPNTASSQHLSSVVVHIMSRPSTIRSNRWSRMVVFARCGGGLHGIGWNFKFSTNAELEVHVLMLR